MLTDTSLPARESSSRLVSLDITLPTPHENLALDEALLDQAETVARGSGPVVELLRFWESPTYFVALGSTGRLAEEVDQQACRRRGIPVLRRSSGGGTVLAGPGCLCFALILSMDRHPELKDIHASYRAILKRLAACLGVEGLSHRGFSDLALGERKVSGNAQRRKSRTLLHHGTLLYDFDLEAMAAVLKDPSRQPDYRNRRVHADFTTNLAVDAEEIRLRISRGWNVSEGHQPLEMPDIQPLLREKYANPSWTDRF